jgi:hypothetical protein
VREGRGGMSTSAVEQARGLREPVCGFSVARNREVQEGNDGMSTVRTGVQLSRHDDYKSRFMASPWRR